MANRLMEWFGFGVEDRTLSSENVPPVMLQSTPGPSVTPRNAAAIADAYACVRCLSDAAASLPLIPYRRNPDGRERLQGGRIVDLLQRPAPATTQANLVGQIVAHLNLHGNAFLGKYKSAGVVEQLGCLSPDRVQVQIKAGRPLYIYTSPGGIHQTLGEADVVHIKALSTDGLLGLSPVRQARTVLSLSDELAKHARVFFENDARPAGILKFAEGTDSEGGMERLREGFRARHGSSTEPSKAHSIAVLSGDVSYEEMRMPLDDAQFLQQRKLSAVEVARIFRVPPWMIGADSGESMTYSNTEQQALSFVTYSLRPHLVAIEQAITNDPDLCFERVYVEFLLDALLRADSKTRAEVYEKALDPVTGWMNRDEVRRLENLEPEGDATAPSVEQMVATATNGQGNPNAMEGSGNGRS